MTVFLRARTHSIEGVKRTKEGPQKAFTTEPTEDTEKTLLFTSVPSVGSVVNVFL